MMAKLRISEIDWRHLGRKALAFVGWLWTKANSPLSIAVISAGLIAWIAHWYSAQDARQKDILERRNKLAVALTEYQQRLSYLQAGDRLWKDRCDYPKASAKEWEAITGSGSYVPTSPGYKDVNLGVVINDVETSTGVPDIRYGTALWAGIFSEPPPNTAFWVRGQLKWLESYGSRRAFLLTMGAIPQPLGEEPSTFTKAMLDLPDATPASRRKLALETDRAHDELDVVLNEAIARKRAPCPS